MDSEISDRNSDISNENAGRVSIPFIAFESVQARNERQMKRLWITVILLIISLVGSNLAWLYFYTQYDYAEYEVTADDGANANYIGGDMEGDINNGGTDKS